MNTSSPVSRLPPELIAKIASISVSEDTAPRTAFPLPVSRNELWANLLGHLYKSPHACTTPQRDCIRSGFVERAMSCSMFCMPKASSPHLVLQKPDGFCHTVMQSAQVSKKWRDSIQSHRALWADATLLNMGFIGRSQDLAGSFPPKLMNPRPLCPCFMVHCIPLIASATSIGITTHAFGESKTLVSETVLLELEAAKMEREGCILRYLDLQLTRPDYQYSLPAPTSIEIDSLLVAQLSNTHFRCYGLKLERLELVAEDRRWRLDLQDIYDTLSRCPNLQHLTLCLVCNDLIGVSLEDARSIDPPPVELSRLQCFILEDETKECLHLLSGITFPADCDFHWTIIEPFGRLEYYIPDFTVSLDICRAIFNERTLTARTPSVIVLEVILDFEGRHLDTGRDIREWPEELRVSFAMSEKCASQQFVTRHPALQGLVYRDLTALPGSPRQSFGVRSRMLSKGPESRNQRHRPAGLSHATAKETTRVQMPALQKVIARFLSSARELNGFISARTIVIPQHAYIPRDPDAWRTLLSLCNPSSLSVGSVSDPCELESLAGYLATRQRHAWPHASLMTVECPYYVGDGRTSQTDFMSTLESVMGNRRGCDGPLWHTPVMK